jgi:hypothetical protein
VLARLLITLVTVVALVGLVRLGGSYAGPDERCGYGLASTDAAGAPDPTPGLDTGSEATLPAAASCALPALATHGLPGPPPAFSVGRHHAVRLFRPPRLAPLA